MTGSTTKKFTAHTPMSAATTATGSSGVPARRGAMRGIATAITMPSATASAM